MKSVVVPVWFRSLPLELRAGLLTAAVVFAAYALGLSLFFAFKQQLATDWTAAVVVPILLQPIGWGVMAAIATWLLVRLKRAF